MKLCSVAAVKSLFNNGAQDILVVSSGDGEILIPVAKSIVVQETTEALIVDLPPGLLFGEDLEKNLKAWALVCYNTVATVETKALDKMRRSMRPRYA